MTCLTSTHRPVITSIPFARLCRSEVRKAATTWASRMLIILMLTGPALICGLMRITADTGHSLLAYFDASLALLGLLLPIQAALVLTSEWGHHTIGNTFLFEPRRLRGIAAKAVVVAAVSLVAITAALCCAYLAHTGKSPTGGDSVSVWAVLGRYLEHLLASGQGFAFGLLLRNTAAAIGVNLFIPFFFTVLTGTLHLGALGHWLNPLLTQEVLTAPSASATDWAQLVVSELLWVGAPTIFGIFRVRTQEIVP